ncbi:PQQ-binding-like beta-propeller repeat protein [Variovorax rhizosphaerae]|uniref:PQQ-binding-like beta-propeller repeat protein n=1 Tax=Variovorax rhizosphaerae TaxID=1836200 RepID=A0ABU8WYZ2_9BURK
MMKTGQTLHWNVLVVLLATCSAAIGADWPSAGRDLRNSRYQPEETKISPKSVGGLIKKWEFVTDGDVTANPAVDGDFVYFPDSTGSLYKVNKGSGTLVWKKAVSNYTGNPGDFARATPAISGNALILGNQSGRLLGANFGQADAAPAKLFAVDKNTGALLWSTLLDATLNSYVTHSAVVVDGTAFVGTASNEELLSAFVPKAFWQWKFRGSITAVDVATGTIKWKTYTVPEGYYGGAIWGSTGAVDRKRNLIFLATGNNYMVPQSVLNCVAGGGKSEVCMSPDNYFDSIIAVDLSTGQIKWGARGLASDAWSVACGLNVPGSITIGPGYPGVYDNCPNGNPATAGPDYDFAQGPMLFNENADPDALVGAGQKSGMFWAFRAKDGKLAWARQVAPGGVTGGLQWGSATNGKEIFVAAANSGPSTNGGGAGAQPWTLKDGSVTSAGGWASLEANTGQVRWTTKDPKGSRAEAAVSLANGVVFGCNMSPSAGTMYALDAKTGAPLWSYDSGAPCTAGPSVADGMVFWGSGTFGLFGPTGPKRVFAFGLR